MKQFLAQVGARDVLVAFGLLLLASGAGMIYRPAALLTTGGVLLYLGLYGVPKWR